MILIIILVTGNEKPSRNLLCSYKAAEPCKYTNPKLYTSRINVELYAKDRQQMSNLK